MQCDLGDADSFATRQVDGLYIRIEVWTLNYPSHQMQDRGTLLTSQQPSHISKSLYQKNKTRANQHGD